jgi:cbb3-type cytochrome oxidase subunit 3
MGLLRTVLDAHVIRLHSPTSTQTGKDWAMPANVARDLRLLRVFTLFNSLLFVGLVASAFTRPSRRARFDEIDVGRINVVEKDGTLRLVISNAERSPGPIYKGTPFGYPGGGRPGLIFFNEEGTEDGGLTWGGKTEKGKFSAFGHLSFDQYDQDQVVNLDYSDDNGRRWMAFTVLDRADFPITQWVAERDSIRKLPEGPAKDAALKRLNSPLNGQPLAAQRVFVGRDRSKAARVSLSDRDGKERLRLAVASLGNARLDFLEIEGKVTYSLPDSVRGRR